MKGWGGVEKRNDAAHVKLSSSQCTCYYFDRQSLPLPSAKTCKYSSILRVPSLPSLLSRTMLVLRLLANVDQSTSKHTRSRSSVINIEVNSI